MEYSPKVKPQKPNLIRDILFGISLLSFVILCSQYPSIPSHTLGDYKPVSSYLQSATNITNIAPIHYMQIYDQLLKTAETRDWGKIVHKPSRLLCAIPTIYPEHKHRVRRIARTWGTLCDRVVWVIGRNSSQFPETDTFGGENLVLDLHHEQSDDLRNIWEKGHRMWSAIASKYINEAEWFTKIDDDSFAMPTNMKNFVQFYNPNVPHYFGHTLMHLWQRSNIVFNAGSSYILSREALLRLAPVLRQMPKHPSSQAQELCVDRPGPGEDVSVGVCLRGLGINPDNTLDALGRQRFFPFRLDGHLKYEKEGRMKDWYWIHKPDHNPGGKDCCSPFPMVMHPYKSKSLYLDKLFDSFHQKYNIGGSANSSVEIPPAPRIFDFNPSSISVDEYRNIGRTPRNQPVFRGYS